MLTVWAVSGIGEISTGDDLAGIIGDRCDPVHPDFSGRALADGDIIAITSKIVSKSEGRVRRAADREASITDETVRIVATRKHRGGTTRIVETALGLVMAAAGVDSSNTPEGTVLLLPVDPDTSARRIASELRERFGIALGVLISDTIGRPWRQGQTDIAIGAAGFRVLDELRGSRDAGGRLLEVSVPAIADEIAGAADLVKGKSAGLPVAVVRGLGHFVHDLATPGARSMIRPAEQDMFRLGSDEAFAAGVEVGRAERLCSESADRLDARFESSRVS